MTGVFLRNCLESFFAVRDLLHTPLEVQIFYGCVNLATGELLHSLFERRVLLAHDLVQVRGSHSGLLQLVVGPSGPDGFVLSHVAHKQNSVLFAESVQEVVNLPGTGETRFIQHVEMFFLGFGLRFSGKVMLQRIRLNSGFSKFLCSPRGGRESLDAVALAFSGVTDGAQRGRLACSGYSLQRRNLIAAGKDLLNCSMLTAAEMWVVLFDLVAGSAADERRILVLARAHQPDVVTLQCDHLVRGEAASDGSMRLPLN